LKPLNYFITLKQGIAANKAEYLYYKREIHGENFVCAGGLWMCNFDEIKKNLIEPQGRAYKLASSELDKEHLPASNFGGRFNFLLSLSQKGAGGKGKWEAYRAAVEDYVTHTEETKLRSSDETAKKLLEKLAEDYKATGMKIDGKFFDDDESGLQDYLLKYLHYALFGIDPFDETLTRPLNTLHYDSRSAAYYLKHLGNVLQCGKFKDWPDMIKEVAKIYEESPALATFEEGQEKYNNMTKNELALLMVAIMSLAGMIGPLTLASIVLGNKPPPPYAGKSMSEIKVTDEWDSLDLDDREEIEKYILECGRLRHPVSNTHKVAQEDFICKVGGKDVKFKKGTIIFIPMILAGLDENVYGSSTFQFDHNRENLCPFSTIFHSFGEETNGRICPGKAVAMTMMTDVLQTLGKLRQSAPAGELHKIDLS